MTGGPPHGKLLSRVAPDVPVAEILAVRDALRFATDRCGLDLANLDEKSLSERGAEILGLTPAEIDQHLKTLGLAAGKPWRKEQKRACLAAWTAVTAQGA